ncbi:MAG: Arc family DNA-binding protein [Gammaproteobacteria bacterium]|nr:Arc family DNA-binding protein [Gammaproteobacteria bacterium]
MPATITLKGIPDAVHEALKASAQTNRRSLNSEAIACLESVLLPRKTTALEHAVKARELRSSLKEGAFQPEDVTRFKRAHRA